MSDIRRIVSGGQFCCNEVGKAIRRGVLKPPREFPCADCGGAATEYDHRDYNLPLVVEPVCRGCNARRGKAIPRRYSRAEIAEKMKRVAAKRRIVPWAREWFMALARLEKNDPAAYAKAVAADQGRV